jgi:hypothetical protein
MTSSAAHPRAILRVVWRRLVSVLGADESPLFSGPALLGVAWVAYSLGPATERIWPVLAGLGLTATAGLFVVQRRLRAAIGARDVVHQDLRGADREIHTSLVVTLVLEAALLGWVAQDSVHHRMVIPVSVAIVSALPCLLLCTAAASLRGAYADYALNAAPWDAARDVLATDGQTFVHRWRTLRVTAPRHAAWTLRHATPSQLASLTREDVVSLLYSSDAEDRLVGLLATPHASMSWLRSTRGIAPAAV